MIDMEIVDAVILSWGLAYLMVAFVKPSILKAVMGRPVPKAFSAVSMVVIAVAMIGNLLILGNEWIYLALALWEVFGLVGNWVGLVEWDTPLSRDVALVSMGIMDWVGAIALLSKII